MILISIYPLSKTLWSLCVMTDYQYAYINMYENKIRKTLVTFIIMDI